MIATLLLAAVLFAPGAARLPAYHPATTVARAIASYSAYAQAGHARRPAAPVDRSQRAAAPKLPALQIVPVVLTTQLRR